MAVSLLLLIASTAQPFYPLYSRPVTSLDGEWSFSFTKEFNGTLETLDVSSIKTPESITVPSAFDVAQPGVQGRRGAAFYRRNITLKKGRAGRLQFAACSFFCRAFVDGVEVGRHFAGGYVPFWLEVPPSTTSSTRELFVLVDNRFNKTTAPVHTGGDFYMYGGITRSVMLHELPAGDAPYLTFLGVLPLNTTHVNVSVTLGGGSVGRLEAIDLLFDGAPNSTAHTTLLAPGSSSSWAPGSSSSWATAPSLAVPHASPWSPTTPHLHNLTAIVRSSGDAATARFGLRTIGTTPSGKLTLNGEEIFLKGVNRHTMSPASGSALTYAEVLADVELLKSLNANYVRGAHYPQDQRFLDLCDERGILIWEEALGPNVKSANVASREFMQAQITQVNEMVMASYSHPSIILHGFFNEGPSPDAKACTGYAACAEAIRALVPPSHRMVTWASSAKEKDKCFDSADVLSFNEYPGWYTESYETVNQTWANFSKWAEERYPKKPFLISETGGGAIYEWSNNASSAIHISGYTVQGGALKAGGDLMKENATWKEAMSKCNASKACLGFTYQGSLAPKPPEVRALVYFKTQTMGNSDAGWVSWLKGPGRPPKWSQGYQSLLVAKDVKAAMSIRRVSGISIWQFNDIKADDGATHSCGSCKYSTPYNASTPMDCAFITAKCWRPGGENHKGLVDFWRRPKRAFETVKALYA